MEITVGFVSLGFLVICNIIVVAFTYGRLTERVDQLCKNISNVNKRVDNMDKDLDSYNVDCPFHSTMSSKVTKLEAEHEIVMKRLEL